LHLSLTIGPVLSVSLVAPRNTSPVWKVGGDRPEAQEELLAVHLSCLDVQYLLAEEDDRVAVRLGGFELDNYLPGCAFPVAVKALSRSEIRATMSDRLGADKGKDKRAAAAAEEEDKNPAVLFFLAVRNTATPSSSLLSFKRVVFSNSALVVRVDDSLLAQGARWASHVFSRDLGLEARLLTRFAEWAGDSSTPSAVSLPPEYAQWLQTILAVPWCDSVADCWDRCAGSGPPFLTPAESMLPDDAGFTAKQIHIDSLEIDALALTVSVKLAELLEVGSTGLFAFVPPAVTALLQRVVSAVGTALLNLEDAAVRFDALLLPRVFSPLPRLIDALTAHYRTAAMKQVLSLAGSVAVLGNPAAVLSSVGVGVISLVKDPLDSGPAGIATGVSALVSGSVYGIATATRSITGALSDALVSAGSDEYRQARSRALAARPEGVASGLAAGVGAIGRGIAGGIVGVGHGFRTGTASGALQGIVGLAVVPVSGVLDAGGLVSEGLRGAAGGRPATQPLRPRRSPPVLFSP
jgi:hypothetical protein